MMNTGWNSSVPDAVHGIVGKEGNKLYCLPGRATETNSFHFVPCSLIELVEFKSIIDIKS